MSDSIDELEAARKAKEEIARKNRLKRVEYQRDVVPELSMKERIKVESQIGDHNVYDAKKAARAKKYHGRKGSMARVKESLKDAKERIEKKHRLSKFDLLNANVPDAKETSSVSDIMGDLLKKEFPMDSSKMRLDVADALEESSFDSYSRATQEGGLSSSDRDIYNRMDRQSEDLYNSVSPRDARIHAKGYNPDMPSGGSPAKSITDYFNKDKASRAWNKIDRKYGANKIIKGIPFLGALMTALLDSPEAAAEESIYDIIDPLGILSPSRIGEKEYIPEELREK